MGASFSSTEGATTTIAESGVETVRPLDRRRGGKLTGSVDYAPLPIMDMSLGAVSDRDLLRECKPFLRAAYEDREVTVAEFEAARNRAEKRLDAALGRGRDQHADDAYADQQDRVDAGQQYEGTAELVAAAP